MWAFRSSKREKLNRKTRQKSSSPDVTQRRRKKVSGTKSRNGPAGASHFWCLTPFSDVLANAAPAVVHSGEPVAIKGPLSAIAVPFRLTTDGWRVRLP